MSDFTGIYKGVVLDNNDPAQRGRVIVQVPSVLNTSPSNWCEPVFPQRVHTPAINEIVYVLFLNGDIASPIYMSTLEIDADIIKAGAITVDMLDVQNLVIHGDQVQGGTLDASGTSITAGSYVQINKDGIFGYQADGTTSRFSLPTDVAKDVYFAGNVDAGVLTVDGDPTSPTAPGAVFNADAQIGVGNSLVLTAGQQAPAQQPQVALGYATVNFTLPSGYAWSKVSGFGYYSSGGTNYLYGVHQTSSNTVRLLTWNASTGSPIGSPINLWPAGSDNINAGGCAVIGSTLYVALSDSNSTPEFAHLTMSLSNPAAPAFGTYYWANGGAPTNGLVRTTTDGTNLYTVFGESGKMVVYRTSPINPTSTTKVLTSTVNAFTPGAAFACTAVGAGGDFSGVRYGFASTGAGPTIKVANSTGEQAADEWEMSTTTGTCGMWWDGTNFWSLDYAGTARKYEANALLRGWASGSASATWYAAYNWTKTGGSYTPRSPAAPFTMLRRSRITVTIGNYAGSGSPNGATIFLRQGSAPTTSGQMYAQTPTLSSPTKTLTITSPVLSGSSTDPSGNTFTGSGTSKITSGGTTPNLLIDSGGSASLVSLNVSGNASVSGTVTGSNLAYDSQFAAGVTPFNFNNVSSMIQTISFGKTVSNPVVTVTPAGTSVLYADVSSVSATGCDITLSHRDNLAYTANVWAHWHVVSASI